ncbi:hypothetical protein BJF78_26800 [Pseudonocardia sp. CNS-139]|nr:hypothetical protein BJF78_26800 [Pseudonocardia sp. CNS-139]
MFALLTGRPAFVTDGDDLLATVARISTNPVPDLRPAGVPGEVCRIVERLMAKTRPAGTAPPPRRPRCCRPRSARWDSG